MKNEGTYKDFLEEQAEFAEMDRRSIMDRRDFLKALGLFASMPFMSKLKFLNREPVREGIAAATDKGIEFYNAVIQKVDS